MNWVPGNLRLIGKNQNNSPLQKGKTSSRPPTLTLSAGMQEQWWGGRLTKCCTHHETQTLQKASHCRNKSVFVLLYCASYISHNLKEKRQYGQVTLVFQHIPSASKGLKESGLFSRGGHSLSSVDLPHLSSKQTVHILKKGIMGEVVSGRDPP